MAWWLKQSFELKIKGDLIPEAAAEGDHRRTPSPFRLPQRRGLPRYGLYNEQARAGSSMDSTRNLSIYRTSPFTIGLFFFKKYSYLQSIQSIEEWRA